MNVDPYRAWSNTMFVGALIACGAYMVEAAWGLAWLSGRVRGAPPASFLRSVQPYFAVITSALMWVGILVLTIDDPIPHAGRGRLRAAALRLLATGSMLGISAYMFGLIENRGRIRNELFLGLDLVELVTTILLWLHLRWIGSRLALDGVQLRAIFAMLAYASVVALVAWPRFSEMLLGRRANLSNEFINFRWSAIVVSSAIAALVMARFAARFRSESRSA